MITAEMLTDFELLSKIKGLPDTEKRIATMVIDRLCAGLREYGPWDRRKHNDMQDILEEQLDAAVYSSAAMLSILDKQKKGS